MFRLIVEPEHGLIDTPRTIRVTGVPPGDEVVISATTVRQGIRWTGYAVFQADASGKVDTALHAPLENRESTTYHSTSRMGLIWSQIPQLDSARQLFNQSVFDPLRTQVSAQSGLLSDSVEMLQTLVDDGVKRIEVEEDDLCGTIFVPAGEGPFPAIVVLNGSGGGINEPRAALYASRGYLAFALGYFKAPGRSDFISNTELRYFENAINWLRENYRPKGSFVAVSGQSRGGELALLLGATFPQIVSAVIAYVPSAFVHSAQNAADPELGREGPTWLLDGKPLPHIWEGNRYASWEPYDDGPAPHRHELAMRTALEDTDAIERARIRVERIRAPILLLSGGDDGSWPSSLYCQQIVDRLKAHDFPYEVRWLDIEKAGHQILFPFVPTTQNIHIHPVSMIEHTSGGEAEADAQANEQSWAEVRLFLGRAFNKGRV